MAIDTGGTFTDVVWWDGRELRITKISSTPDDPARAVIEGVERALAQSSGFSASDGHDLQVVHGSTVATNAVLERKGAQTAFVTNRGFRDLALIGRQNRPALYDLQVCRAEPLVSRCHCLSVDARMGPGGEILHALDERAVCQLIHQLDSLMGSASAPESVAVCLLHSYLNPEHERRLGELLEQRFPELEVSLSSDVLPVWREYERASTTLLNAYVQPKMRHYLSRLSKSLGARLAIIQSDGGLVQAEEAAELPVHTLLSGPAGGVVGARQVGLSLGLERLVSFDMGGTSSDVSLIDGQPTLTREGQVGGVSLGVTIIDIHTVGAGGGSIAWCDSGGALKVGPHSAGAKPGPACYGAGGEPTVTDAHVILGRLPAYAFLGGQVILDRQAAFDGMSRLAERLGLGVEQTAAGVIEVINAHMVRAIKVITLERGHDPREFTLVAFGGAGGLHACELAEQLGISSVLVPPSPGVLSAFGMLGAEVTREFSLTVLKTIDPSEGLTFEQIEPLVEPLSERGRRFLHHHHVPAAAQHLEVWLDMRYLGQSFELAVRVESTKEDLLESFQRQHQWRFGYRLEDHQAQWVTLRVRARGLRPLPEVAPATPFAEGKVAVSAGGVSPDALAHEPPSNEGSGESTSVGSQPKFFWRQELEPGQQVEGPAIVAEYSATTFVPPNWTLEVRAGSVLQLRHALAGGAR